MSADEHEGPMLPTDERPVVEIPDDHPAIILGRQGHWPVTRPLPTLHPSIRISAGLARQLPFMV